MAADVRIHGAVAAGFEAVREVFLDNFARRRELGGAVCAYVHGEKVVDLWGGVRNKATGEPWNEDTMALVYSATKGLAAMTLALATSPQLQFQFLLVGLMLAFLWYLYMHLPHFLRHLLSRLFRRYKRDDHGH